MKVPTMSEMGDIHEAAIRIITKTGLKVDNQEILGILKEKGIDVNLASNIVKLPKDEVYETIRQIVGCDEIKFNANGIEYPQEEKYMPDGVEPQYIGYMHGLVYDYEKNDVRQPCHRDMKNFIKMAGYLGLPGKTAVVSFDVPQSVISIHALAMSMKYSNKPAAIETDSIKDAKWIPRLWEVYFGKKLESGYSSSYVSAKSLLVIGGRAADILLRQSQDGILTTVSGMPMTGASTPITLASSIVIHLAEYFGFNTISRLLCKGPNNKFGRRSISFAPCMIDVRKGVFFLTGPESLILRAVWNRIIGEFYKLPAIPGVSLYVNAQQPGMQASEEAALVIMAHLFAIPWYSDKRNALSAGCLGSINSNFTMSYEQVLLEIELIQQVDRFLKGMKVDEETLAVDIINEVGHGGSFLDTEHTLKHYRDEFWFGRYSFRGAWKDWMESGARHPVEKAHEHVRQILDVELNPVVSSQVSAEIDRVVGMAERDILGSETGILP